MSKPHSTYLEFEGQSYLLRDFAAKVGLDKELLRQRWLAGDRGQALIRPKERGRRCAPATPATPLVLAPLIEMSPAVQVSAPAVGSIKHLIEAWNLAVFGFVPQFQRGRAAA